MSSEGADKRDSVATPSRGSEKGHGGSSDMQAPANRFTLDSIIEDEGSNLSIGQVRIFRSVAQQNVSSLCYIVLWLSDHWFPSPVRW